MLYTDILKAHWSNPGAPEHRDHSTFALLGHVPDIKQIEEAVGWMAQFLHCIQAVIQVFEELKATDFVLEISTKPEMQL